MAYDPGIPGGLARLIGVFVGFTCKHQELELVAAKFEENNNLVNVDQFMKAFRPRVCCVLQTCIIHSCIYFC